jgi:Tol biopolymer transport system component/tetratricopeptide (TPR) repeat protein
MPGMLYKARLALAVSIPLFAGNISAQTQRVTLTEGTNMAAAVSPDGRQIAIDLVGRIWVLPSEGGEATPLIGELWDARQPSWSPDGREIAFQAYLDGNYHIWVVDLQGHTRQLTSGPFDHREPNWSPDGGSIVFSSDRAGTYDLWTLDVESDALRRLTTGTGNEWGGSFSPDGGEIAYSVRDNGGSGVGIYNLRDGSDRTVTHVRGTPEGVSWTRNGSFLTFTLLGQGRADLAMVPASGGDPEMLVEGRDVFPFRTSYLATGERVFTADGHIVAAAAHGLSERTIDFSGVVELNRQAYSRTPRAWDADGAHPVRGIKSPQVSPDGRRIAFAALGDLWVRELDGSTTQLTDDAYLDSDPAWSRDGTRIAFSSDRNGSMDIWIFDEATGRVEPITSEPLAEMSPAWSPDGSKIAFVTKGGITDPGFVKVIDLITHETLTLTPNLFNPGHPTWSPDGRYVLVSVLDAYSSRFREGINRIARVDADGGGMEFVDGFEHVSLGTRGTDGPVWSPDGNWMAYTMDGLLWAHPVDRAGNAIGPARRLTNVAAEAPSWPADSRSVVYLDADELKRVPLDGGAAESLPIDLTWEREIPDGSMVVHAGRFFDGISDEIQRDVDILITGNRVSAIFDHDDSHHNGRVIDAGRHVVMPGLIESHGHQSELGEYLGRQWLSWGVTSIRDPASDPYESLERREAIESGRRLGPRTYNAGYMFDGGRIYYTFDMQIRSSAQVEAELDRAQALGYSMVKTYVRLPDALQKQVVAGAHARGMWVSSHEIYPSVSYGGDGVEHLQGTSRRGYSPKITQMRASYQDVVALLAESGMTLTPTMTLSGGFQALMARDPGEYLDDARMRAFEPRGRANQMARFMPTTPAQIDRGERLLRNMQRTVREVVRQGGTVIAGTDAPILPRGLSLHMELEAYVDGGLTPFQALQTAGINAAQALEGTGQIGMLWAGSLADLLLLDGNPLEDIRNTKRIRAVIKNGEYFTQEDLLLRPGMPLGTYEEALLADRKNQGTLPEGAQALSLLGEVLWAPRLSPEVRQRLQADLTAAEAVLEADPGDADALIWVGRRHAYLGDYRSAIDFFTRGIELHPDDARFFRHRGHRYLSVRELDNAIRDFERAAELMEGTPDAVEPDGAPNALGIPIGTLHHNVWYHLGLTRYVQGDFDGALRAYEKCRDVSTNNDAMVSCAYWLYLINRRLGNDSAAERIAADIPPDLELIENFAYYRLLLLYNGTLSEADLLGSDGGEDTPAGSAIHYGVAAWHLLNGDEARADQLFSRILESESWAPFGYLAAEAEVARRRGGN